MFKYVEGEAINCGKVSLEGVKESSKCVFKFVKRSFEGVFEPFKSPWPYWTLWKDSSNVSLKSVKEY